MKPVDYRNETFAGLKAKWLVDLRLEVLEGLKVHGPCTTKQLAAAMRPADPLFLLDVRPRVTELCQLGFAVLVDNSQPPSTDHCPLPASSGGYYRAASEFEARALFDAAKRDALREQLLMKV